MDLKPMLLDLKMTQICIWLVLKVHFWGALKNNHYKKHKITFNWLNLTLIKEWWDLKCLKHKCSLIHRWDQAEITHPHFLQLTVMKTGCTNQQPTWHHQSLVIHHRMIITMRQTTETCHNQWQRVTAAVDHYQLTLDHPCIPIQDISMKPNWRRNMTSNCLTTSTQFHWVKIRKHLRSTRWRAIWSQATPNRFSEWSSQLKNMKSISGHKTIAKTTIAFQRAYLMKSQIARPWKAIKNLIKSWLSII